MSKNEAENMIYRLKYVDYTGKPREIDCETLEEIYRRRDLLYDCESDNSVIVTVKCTESSNSLKRRYKDLPQDANVTPGRVWTSPNGGQPQSRGKLSE